MNLTDEKETNDSGQHSLKTGKEFKKLYGERVGMISLRFAIKVAMDSK